VHVIYSKSFYRLLGDFYYIVFDFIITFLVMYRMALLLGPPSSGKTTLLLALAGKLDSELRVHYQPYQFIIKLQIWPLYRWLLLMPFKE
jgi:DNA polymerase III delta prime subunit